MKNLTIIGLCLFLTIQSEAQRIGLTIEYGLSTSVESKKELFAIIPEFSVYEYSHLSSQSSPTIGLTLYDENDHLWVQSTISFGKQENNYQIENTTDDFLRVQGLNEIKTSAVVIPLAVAGGFRFNKLKLGVGPTLVYYRNYQTTNSSEFPAAIRAQETQSKIFGFQFLVGYKISDHLHVDLIRKISFNDVGTAFYFEGAPIELKSNSQSIALGVNMLL